METLTRDPQLSDPDTEIDKSKYSHVVFRERGDTRHTSVIIAEAILTGTPVTALCGYTWVPSANGTRGLPVCPKCKEMLDFEMNVRGF